MFQQVVIPLFTEQNYQLQESEQEAKEGNGAHVVKIRLVDLILHAGEMVPTENFVLHDTKFSSMIDIFSIFSSSLNSFPFSTKHIGSPFYTIIFRNIIYFHI